jgi:cobalt transporter subunit CbtA
MPLTQAARTFKLPVFKRILSVAALAGFLAGALLTAVQQLWVVPLIIEAEVHENSAAQASAPRVVTKSNHDHEAWRPVEGRERTFRTLVANVVMAVGFALLLGALICLHGKMTSWRSGLLWGLAGYIVFVAPSLGLPPEVPGTESARLAERQIWWLFAVMCAGAGLWILVFARSFLAKSAGALLLAVPHLIGAPQPQINGSLAPPELASSFFHATALANAVFWLLLGSLVGFFYRKFA